MSAFDPSVFLETLEVAMKLKRIMLKKGIRQCKAKCDKCEGMIYASLAGRKNHVHMGCNGSCKRAVME